ncbi:MAG: hypothetical protein CMM02_08415 [Rhodopirellula sp.]|nr:hypothetical protein [Rhodopirellula sp.]
MQALNDATKTAYTLRRRPWEASALLCSAPDERVLAACAVTAPSRAPVDKAEARVQLLPAARRSAPVAARRSGADAHRCSQQDDRRQEASVRRTASLDPEKK